MGMTADEFHAVYAEHGTRLLRIAVLVSGDSSQAEDAVAEAFARCWKRWRRVPPADPGAYLRRTLLNHLARSGGRRNREQLMPVETPAVPPGPEQAMDVREALTSLTFERRAVVVLRYLDDLSEAQTAAVLGLPIGTVKSRAARGLRDLEPMLRSLHEVSDD